MATVSFTDPKQLGSDGQSVTTTTEISLTTTFSTDGLIRSLYYEIPNGTQLVITLTPIASGPAVVLLDTTATAAETGAVAVGRPFKAGGSLAYVTTNGINAAKKVHGLFSPAVIGV